MKKNLLFFAMLFFSIMSSLTHAAIVVDMGNSVKTGNYYTFPDLTVTGDPGDKGYVVRFMFTRAVETGDKIEWPSLPGGWLENANSSEFVRMIDISTGATPADLQTFLRMVQISLKAGKNGHAVMVLISESAADAGRTIYYSSDTEQWYEYVPAEKIRWDDAYNAALDRSFLMQKGYLAVITKAVENQFIHSIKGPSRYGWIGGTRMDIRPVLNPVTGKLTGEPGPSLDYWYWAAGPEWTDNGKDPSKSVFYNKKTASDPAQSVSVKYDYNNWAPNEPDNASWGNDEAYTHLYGNATWNDYSVDNTSINGYIVEYPGTPVANAIGLVGYNSTKSASLNGGTINNGTSSNPVLFVGGDVITYTITAVNTSDENESVTVRDTVPVGMAPSSISHSGQFNPLTRVITWDLTEVSLEGSTNVTYQATKTAGATGLMVNTAYVTSSGTIISKTNSTFHKGEVCTVTFAADAGGTLNNGNPQIIDYGDTPNAGVIEKANSGYKSKGWSYPSYTDLKGTLQNAGDDIADYKTIAIYGNVTLTAKFEKETYNISYTLNDGAVSGTNPTNYDVTTPTFTLINPTKPGYTFNGWTGTNGTTPQTEVKITTGSTGDRDYEANWKPAPYNISYIVDPDVTNPPSNPVLYNIEDTPITLANPTRPGYTFSHWTIASDVAITIPNGTTIPSGTYGNLTCTAVWDIDTYTITYHLNDGTETTANPTSYKVTDLPITLNNPTKPGYTFAGWTGSNGTTALTTVTITTTSSGVPGNLTYTANWTPIAYTISYNVGTGGSNPAANPGSYNIDDTPITLANPTRPGYAFQHWTIVSDASVTIPDGTTITSGTYGNLTCTAVWNTVSFPITYELNGGTGATNPSTYTVTSPDITLNNPIKSGFTFLGWTGHNGTTPQTIVTIPTGSTGPRHYVANWTEDDYLIKYDYKGGDAPASPNKSSYKAAETPFSISNQPTRPGYTFTGWTGSNGTTPQTTINVVAGTTGDLNYNANWTAIPYDITYVLGSGGINHASNPTGYNVATPTITLKNPTRPGFTFSGWTIASTEPGIPDWQGNTIPTGTIGNLTCTAVWDAVGYPISYDYKGGTAPATANPASYTIEDTPFYISNQPTRPGYTFDGWTGSNGTIPQTTVNVGAGSTGPLDYDANWTALPYSITYDVGTGGSNPASNPLSYNIEDTPIPLTNPTRPGYTFSHWSITSDAAGIVIPNGTTIPSRTYGNLACTAVWNIAAYTILYDYDGGTAPTIANPTSYDITTLPVTLNPPTRPGYTFDDWTITSTDPVTIPDGATIPVGTTGNLVCKANWTIISYNIIYNLNGGSGGSGNPTSYDVTDTPFSISDQPAKSGHTFVGWTGSNGSIPETSVNVPLNTTGDLEYDAKWSFQFADDTVFSCTPPLLLQSGHDGLDYVWILPDGSSKTTANIYVQTSGEYILRTNYGSMVIADTIYVLFAFEENAAIQDISTAGPKIGRPQVFTVNMNPELTNVTYQWTFGNGGTPATSTSDTATVVYNTTGSKQVSVEVTVTLGTLVCQKTLSLNLDIFESKRNFFVDQHVIGGLEDGSSWQDAYRRVEDALVNASEGDCIWVAKGEYTPPANSSYLLSRDSVEIYGGFGAWEENLYERNFANNPTILRGSGISVITNTNAGREARWDGFIIENGTATHGGAIFNNNSSVTIANCVIRNNTADEGGAIYSTSGAPFLYNVVISGNTAKNGGAMHNFYANPLLINVTISGNRATTGGGLYNENANPEVLNSIIWGNQADTDIANNASTPFYSYSLIAGSKAGGSWNTALGTNGGNNLDGSPLFKKKGFDDNGNMQTGDYRLSGSSSAIDRGLNRYVYNVPVRWSTHLETLTDVFYLSEIPNDLSGNERIANDRVDMGAYEYNSDVANPNILREVVIPEINGLITDPAAGKYYVQSRENFVFTITAALKSYNLDNLIVKTGNEIRDEEGVKMVKNEDGSVTVTLLNVTENITLMIYFSDPSSNGFINGQKVWSHNSNIFVNTDKQSNIQIYTMMGQLFLQQKVDAGETIIPLPQGFYTIKLNGQVYKVAVK